MRTFVEVIRDNSVYSDHAHTFVASDGTERRISFPELWGYACQRAHRLHQLGLKKGDRVAIILPETDSFILNFIGAVAGGIVPVPMYPPVTLAKMEAYGETVRHILSASGAKVLITSPTLRDLLQDHIVAPSGEEPLRVILDEELVGEPMERAVPPCDVDLDDLAFLQFTSGSTRKPKGVMVTHRNLSHNAHSIMFEGLKSTSADKGVSWLPLYHDMGLIGFVVAPVYAQVQVMFLPTMGFIRRPSLWLDAIHRFRGTITFAPNFAYALATRAIRQSDSAAWDLSCLKALGCGAEPIQADTLRAFLERFAENDLKPQALLPCYGLAEATLAVTFSRLDASLHSDRLDGAAMKNGDAVPTHKADGVEVVSCGKPFRNHDIRIVDDSGEPVSDRRVGRVMLRGPSVSGGYFCNPAETAETFVDGWLKTGDLGYLAEGELYVCGREKDLIIINGKNFYPQDIERIASQVRELRAEQCVAFAHLDEGGKERCVLVAELVKRGTDRAQLQRDIVLKVRSELGITIDEVVFIKRNTLPKTSSGKVRRRETKWRFERGGLELSQHDSRPPVANVPTPRPSSPATL